MRKGGPGDKEKKGKKGSRSNPVKGKEKYQSRSKKKSSTLMNRRKKKLGPRPKFSGSD